MQLPICVVMDRWAYWTLRVKREYKRNYLISFNLFFLLYPLSPAAGGAGHQRLVAYFTIREQMIKQYENENPLVRSDEYQHLHHAVYSCRCTNRQKVSIRT